MSDGFDNAMPFIVFVCSLVGIEMMLLSLVSVFGPEPVAFAGGMALIVGPLWYNEVRKR